MKFFGKTFSFQKITSSFISIITAFVMLMLCCSCSADDNGNNNKRKNKKNSSDHSFSSSDTDDDDLEDNKEKSGDTNEIPENSSANVQIVTVTSVVTVTAPQETAPTTSETKADGEKTKSTKKTVTTNRTEPSSPTTIRTEAVKTTDSTNTTITQKATQAATAPPKTTTVHKTTEKAATARKTTTTKPTTQAVKTTAAIATTPSQTQKQPVYGVDYTIDTSKTGRDSAKASEIAKCINILRKYIGVSSLSYSKDLEKAAMVRAEEIVNNFSHERPDGASGLSAIWQYTSRSHLEGENIGQCGAVATAEFMYSLWLNSPNHYKIMTDPGFSRCGVGVYYKNGSTYTVLLVAGD